MHLKFTTFDDVDEHVVAEWTGLSRPRSVLARKHEACVTLIWRDSDEQMRYFAAELARQRLKIVGVHASGIFWTPAAAKTWRFTGLWTSIACTRATNRRRWAWRRPHDAPLLDSVGFAVVVKGFNREGISLINNDPARVYHTQHTGPTGWCEGLDYFLR